MSTAPVVGMKGVGTCEECGAPTIRSHLNVDELGRRVCNRCYHGSRARGVVR